MCHYPNHISNLEKLPEWTHNNVLKMANRRDTEIFVSQVFQINSNTLAATLSIHQYWITSGDSYFSDGDWHDWEIVYIFQNGKRPKLVAKTNECEYVETLHLSRTRKSLVTIIREEGWGPDDTPYRYRELFLLSDLNK